MRAVPVHVRYEERAQLARPPHTRQVVSTHVRAVREGILRRFELSRSHPHARWSEEERVCYMPETVHVQERSESPHAVFPHKHRCVIVRSSLGSCFFFTYPNSLAPRFTSPFCHNRLIRQLVRQLLAIRLYVAKVEPTSAAILDCEVSTGGGYMRLSV